MVAPLCQRYTITAMSVTRNGDNYNRSVRHKTVDTIYQRLKSDSSLSEPIQHLMTKPSVTHSQQYNLDF